MIFTTKPLMIQSARAVTINATDVPLDPTPAVPIVSTYAIDPLIIPSVPVLTGTLTQESPPVSPATKPV